MATNSSKGMDTGTKVVIGFASVALILFLVNGSPDNDAWQDDSGDKDAEDVTSGDPNSVDLDLDEGDQVEVPPDDPWTRGAPSGSGSDDGDDEPEPPVDDPWTRGAPSQDDGDDDGDAEPPVDDPWTRGSDADGGFGDDGLPACVGVTGFETDDGTVDLPIDRTENAWASSDCTIMQGQSGNAVWLVQVALDFCNGQAVPLDSVHGDAMSQALVAVQAANGIAADGVYGPATREAMAWPTVPSRQEGGAGQCIPHPGVG